MTTDGHCFDIHKCTPCDCPAGPLVPGGRNETWWYPRQAQLSVLEGMCPFIGASVAIIRPRRQECHLRSRWKVRSAASASCTLALTTGRMGIDAEDCKSRRLIRGVRKRLDVERCSCTWQHAMHRPAPKLFASLCYYDNFATTTAQHVWSDTRQVHALLHEQNVLEQFEIRASTGGGKRRVHVLRTGHRHRSESVTSSGSCIGLLLSSPGTPHYGLRGCDTGLASKLLYSRM